MNILIVSATQQEVAPVLDKFIFQEKISERLVHYTANHNNVYFLFTGVGMVATTFHLTQTLQLKNFQCIVNAGIAGAISSVALGTVVNVVDDCFYELGAEDGDTFIPIQNMNLLNSLDYPLTEKSIPFKNNFISNSIVNSMEFAHGITVNKIHGSNSSIETLHKNIVFNNKFIFVESMEGAAVAYVASQMNIDAIQIRSISNRVEKRNRNNWEIGLAIENLNQILYNFLMSV